MNHTKAKKIDVKSKWHPEQVKAAVRMTGTTLEALAIKSDLPPNAFSVALARPYRKAEIVRAKFLGVPLHELWPDRWTTNDKRIRPRYAHLYINTAAA